RLRLRDQRRDFGPLTSHVAVCARQYAVDHLEIRPAGQGAPPLESFELWHLRDAPAGVGHGREPERSMGQLSTADDDRVDVGLADHLAGKAVAYLCDLCDSVHTLGLYTQLDHRPSFPGGGGTDHWADVSALHLLHDHRPEDHCAD